MAIYYVLEFRVSDDEYAVIGKMLNTCDVY